MVFCWSCDEGPLKWDKKNLPSLQFTSTDRISLLSTLPPNGRSMPFRYFWKKEIFLSGKSDEITRFDGDFRLWIREFRFLRNIHGSGTLLFSLGSYPAASWQEQGRWGWAFCCSSSACRSVQTHIWRQENILHKNTRDFIQKRCLSRVPIPPSLNCEELLKGDFSYFFMYVTQHCFICRPSDSTVPEDAGIEPRTVTSTEESVKSRTECFPKDKKLLS